MVDVYYCPNVECPFGINLTELFKTAEKCPKCGAITRKLGFSDVVKLVEEKKKCQEKAVSLLDKAKNNQQFGDDKKDAEPASPLDADAPVLVERSEDEIQRTIDDLRNFELHEEYVQRSSGETSAALPEDAQKSFLDELRVLIEQNKVLMKQNELILGSVNLRKLKSPLKRRTKKMQIKSSTVS